MAGLTQAELEARLEKVKAALNGTLDRNAQSYTIAGRSLTSFSLKELSDFERSLVAQIKRIEDGGIRVRQVVPS